MSRTVMRSLVALVLLTACGLFAYAAVPANSIKFTGGTPAVGPQKGEIATTVAWDGAQLGLAKVEIVLYETVDGAPKVLDSKQKAATNSPGTWAYTFTGLTSGKVVTGGYTRTMDGKNTTITDAGAGQMSITVP